MIINAGMKVYVDGVYIGEIENESVNITGDKNIEYVTTYNGGETPVKAYSNGLTMEIELPMVLDTSHYLDTKLFEEASVIATGEAVNASDASDGQIGIKAEGGCLLERKVVIYPAISDCSTGIPATTDDTTNSWAYLIPRAVNVEAYNIEIARGVMKQKISFTCMADTSGYLLYSGKGIAQAGTITPTGV